ncbi:O-methyltransferase involved in polyketide biosynthesis [Actinopolyspora biskrensis]|uniref:O-methyltransferase involved in polyketide biosynthesis n=1 Tax=Actinopolyspora biskrensis TaxID=1470178 RepID=A0A852Z3U3_9ACTN|nr:SAM-dependent methyltransferase [Actinopolyspora biskrensis]NYH80672.1 O-methyltransferase involved in polyketide biosynthesis [Actinopolyspora biskrensis]
MRDHEENVARLAPRSSELDEHTPNIARMYDYFLGGSTNFAADRAAAEQLLRAFPGNTEWAHINRAFLGRAVRACAEAGIEQFLDLGSGIPTRGNVHEIAQQVNPAARVAYVDIEPIAVSHARHLLAGNRHVTMTQADVREPETVLAAPGVSGLLDFTRPVAVLAAAVLDIIDTPDPATLVTAYRDACPGGSALVLSHSAALDASTGEVEGAQRVFESTTTPTLRTRERSEVLAMFDGYELLEPGLVPSARWRPVEPVSEEYAVRSNGYGAVGVLR